MRPLVSILIPAYNAEQWIAGTIASALDQTWSNKEIVVVDDGSSDATLQVTSRFASRTVRVATQLNGGASAARNTALSLCQGDYIQWLDADDLLAPDKIERQIRALDETSTARTLLSGEWGYFMHRHWRARFTPTPLWQDLTPVDWLLLKMSGNLFMQTDSWLVSHELTTAAGPWDCRLWKDNDGEYFCRVIAASDGIKFVPGARSYYRTAGFSSVSYIGRSNAKIESLFLSMMLHMRCLRSMEDSERTRAACLRYMRTCLPEFYPYRMDIVESLRRIAVEIGGRLEEPCLSWKYQWMVKVMGWRVARQAQRLAPRLKGSVIIAWDRALFQMDRRTRAERPHRVRCDTRCRDA